MQRFVNNYESRLAAAISNSDNQLSLQAGDGAALPDISHPDDFVLLTLEGTSQIEIVRVTEVAGDTLTVLRGQEGTTAFAWDADTRIEGRATAETLQRAVDLDRILTTDGHVLVNEDGNVLTTE